MGKWLKISPRCPSKGGPAFLTRNRPASTPFRLGQSGSFSGPPPIPSQTRTDRTKTRPYRTRPDQAGPYHDRPDQTRPDQARPDQTTPGRSILDQTRPGQTRPDQNRPDPTIPDQPRTNQTKTDHPRAAIRRRSGLIWPTFVATWSYLL